MNKKEPTLKLKIRLDEFRLKLNDIIRYTIEGEVKRGNAYGVHYFRSSNHQILEMIHETNHCGVWEAMIEMRHPKTNAWVKKKKSSTFFPVSWTEDELRFKLEEAFINSKPVSSFKSIGYTSCNVPVVFIFKNKIVSCCYPLRRPILDER